MTEETGDRSPDWKGYGWDQIEVERLIRFTWGDKSMDSPHERGIRVQEEATELGQVVGVTRAEAHKIVDMVHDKAVGELKQEVAGVAFTLLGMCALQGIRLDDVFVAEMTRFKAKDPAHFRHKQRIKADLGVSIRPE